MLPRLLVPLAAVALIGLAACSSSPTPAPTAAPTPGPCPAAPAAYKSAVSQFLAGIGTGNAAEVNSLNFTDIAFTSNGQTQHYQRSGAAGFDQLRSAVTAAGVAAGDVTKVLALDNTHNGEPLQPGHVYAKSSSGKAIVLTFGSDPNGPVLTGFAPADTGQLTQYHCSNL